MSTGRFVRKFKGHDAVVNAVRLHAGQLPEGMQCKRPWRSHQLLAPDNAGFLHAGDICS